VIDMSRFQTDELPDATWGLCGGHKNHPDDPAVIVRLVDENGTPTAGGLCQICWEESRNVTAFFSCPTHGIQPKAPGREGCPIPNCVGASDRPSEDEIQKTAESIGRVWPGGPPLVKDGVDAPAAGPSDERGGEARESARSEAGTAHEHDRGGEPHGQQWRDPFLNP